MSKIKEWWTSTTGHWEISNRTKSLSICVFIVLIVFLLIGLSTCEQKKREQDNLIKSLKASKDSIHHFKDENGVLHNRIQSLVLYSNQFKEVGEVLGLKVDSMKKVIKNLNGLVYYYKGQIKEEQPFMFAMEEEVKDTTKKDLSIIKTNPVSIKHFNHNTKYLHFEGKYNPVTDSVKGSYSWKSEFELFVYKKKQGLFKPNLTYADIILTDPNASLVNGKSLLITQKAKWYDSKGVHIVEGVILGGLGVYGASLIFK